MLDIYLKNGLIFSHFKDVLHYMNDENLGTIEIEKVDYCLERIFGKCTHTYLEIEKIANNDCEYNS